LVVVVSGSREHFRTLDPTALGIVPVLITAPASILRQRLMDRGRDSESSVAERLGRAEAHAIDDPAVTVIDNSGPLDQAGRRLVELLGRLAASAQT